MFLRPWLSDILVSNLLRLVFKLVLNICVESQCNNITLDLMESSIGQSVHRGLERETWEPGRFGCQTSDEVLWKLDALQTFITDLNWPEKVFATHLQHRLKATVQKHSKFYITLVA